MPIFSEKKFDILFADTFGLFVHTPHSIFRKHISREGVFDI
jgi:hypothetical protein